MPKPTIIDIEVDEVIIEPTSASQQVPPDASNPSKTSEFTKSDQSTDSKKSNTSGPFSSFPGMGGQLNWKHLLLGKIISAFTRRNGLFRSKLWIPVWIVLGILIIAIALIALVLGIIYTIIKTIFRPYTDLFRKKN